MIPTIAVLFLLTWTATMWWSMGPPSETDWEDTAAYARHCRVAWIGWAATGILLLTLLILSHFH